MSVICKFEEYIIKIGLKANLDQLVVIHAILMIWNLKRKQIVTCFFFFKKKKKLVIATILLENLILILLNFSGIIPSV